MCTPTENVRLYDQDALWERSYLDDPYYRAKVRLVRGMMPDFYAPARMLPAAPRAGFRPLYPQFSPTHFHKNPYFYYLAGLAVANQRIASTAHARRVAACLVE